MNKLTTFIVLFLLSGFISANAQEATGNTAKSNYPLIENKLEKSEKDLINPKKNAATKYWLSRAEIMMDAFNVNYEFLAKSTQLILIKLQLGEPLETKTEVRDGVEYITNVYDRVTVVFVNGLVDSYEETKPLHDNPLPLAYEALEKAKELDVDKKSEKKIVEGYERLTALFERQAVEAYLKDDFKKAFVNFESSVKIGQKEFMVGKVDTVVIFNTAMTASRAELEDESIKYYELALTYNYDEPTLYVFLKNKYLAKGDTTKGVELLQDGFKRYPENQDIVVELINYYLQSGKGDQALDYIQIAQEKDPKNVSLIFAEATLYDKQGDIDKAIATYKKAIEVDPTYFNGYYNLGVVYYNYAQKFYDEATNASNTEYKAIMIKGDEQLKLAIPMMKKCYELNPEETSTLETLKSIYYRLKMDAEYAEVKAILEK